MSVIFSTKCLLYLCEPAVNLCSFTHVSHWGFIIDKKSHTKYLIEISQAIHQNLTWNAYVLLHPLVWLEYFEVFQWAYLTILSFSAWRAPLWCPRSSWWVLVPPTCPRGSSKPRRCQLWVTCTESSPRSVKLSKHSLFITADLCSKRSICKVT